LGRADLDACTTAISNLRVPIAKTLPFLRLSADKPNDSEFDRLVFQAYYSDEKRGNQ